MVFTPEIRSGMLLAAVGLDRQLRSLMELEELAAVPTGAWRLWKRSARAHRAWTRWRDSRSFPKSRWPVNALIYRTLSEHYVRDSKSTLKWPWEYHSRMTRPIHSWYFFKDRPAKQSHTDGDKKGYINIHLIISWRRDLESMLYLIVFLIKRLKTGQNSYLWVNYPYDLMFHERQSTHT